MTDLSREQFMEWIDKNNNTIDFNEMDKFIKGVKANQEWDGETGQSIYNFMNNEANKYKELYEESQKTINSLKSDIESLRSEKESDQENLNNQINKMMKKIYDLIDSNKDLKLKYILAESNKNQLKDTYERKIKFLSDENEKYKTELSKSETEKQKLYTEIEGLKSNTTAIKSSSSEYIDLGENLETSEEIPTQNKEITGGNNDLIRLNTDDVGLFMNNLKRGNGKTLKKEQEFFKEEIEKYDNKEANKNQEIFKKRENISYTTDYMPEYLKNSCKMGRIHTTENNKNFMPDYENLKQNQNLEIIEEEDEKTETKPIKQINQILGGNQLPGNYKVNSGAPEKNKNSFLGRPNTLNKPKNHIYEINGLKKMYIGNEFTTLTEQGEKDTKQRHLDYKRKNNRYKKRTEAN